MKRPLKILGIVFLSIFILMIGAVFAIRAMGMQEELPVIQMDKVELNKIADGSYTGEYLGKLVKVVVEVTVKDNKIVDIVIMKHDNGLGKKAEKIVDQIIKRQSLDVEVVSGATSSSKAILKAVEVALSK
ncbi:MAG: FMN-binding protein [Clostridia bacterium]|nr:FMN-binding protein [Clostridia bacterium]